VRGDRAGNVLDREIGLLLAAGLFEDVLSQDIADAVRPVWQPTLDGAPTGLGIENAIALDGQPPSLVKGGLVVNIPRGQTGSQELAQALLTQVKAQPDQKVDRTISATARGHRRASGIRCKISSVIFRYSPSGPSASRIGRMGSKGSR